MGISANDISAFGDESVHDRRPSNFENSPLLMGGNRIPMNGLNSNMFENNNEDYEGEGNGGGMKTRFKDEEDRVDLLKDIKISLEQ